MRGRKWGVIMVVTVIAIIAAIIVRNPRSGAAQQGTICGDYRLPEGAQVHQVGANWDAQGSKIIEIVIIYQGPSGVGTIAVPFDTVAVTCADPKIRGELLNAQQAHRDVIEASCKFVGDLLTGVVQVPSNRVFDHSYAEEWYRKTCLGNR